MQTLESINNIISNTRFALLGKDFRFVVQTKGDGFLLKLECYLPDNETGELKWLSGGKYYISSHAIDDEIVLTAWKACQDYIIHEARETFTYKEQTIFQPHYSVDELAEFCSTAKVVRRPQNNITNHLEDVKTSQDIDF